MTPDFKAFREQFYALVESSEHIVITSHFSPDDDSIGSVLSVYTVLTTQYPTKDIRIIYTGPSVDRYKIFINFDKIEFVPDVAHEVAHADLLICLDASQYYRFSKTNPDTLAQVPKQISIDHHAGAPASFTLALVAPQYSSACELIYRALEIEPLLTKPLAEVLLAGIVSDTGSFSHVAPAQADVFSVAKVLLEHAETSIDALRARYSGIPQRIIPLLKELVNNTTYQSVPGWPDVQYSYIDRSVMQEGNYTDEDMSASSHIYLSQYLPRIQGYDWGFVATPRTDGSARMSSRSLPGGVNVRELHERIGIGSGHNRAAGADFKKQTVDREPKQCIVEVLEWMSHNTPL